MGNKLRLTVVREWEPDLDNYKGVEWPADSGQTRDLTDLEDIRAYEEYLYNNGDTDVAEALNVDDPDDYVVRWEIAPEAQIMDPTLASAPGQENPFLDTQRLPDDVASDAGAKAEASGVAAETDEEYVARETAERDNRPLF